MGSIGWKTSEGPAAIRRHHVSAFTEKSNVSVGNAVPVVRVGIEQQRFSRRFLSI